MKTVSSQGTAHTPTDSAWWYASLQSIRRACRGGRPGWLGSGCVGTPEFSAIAWRTSSRSNGERDCVEVAVVPGRVGVRDSKDRSGPALLVPPSAWRAFVGDLQRGELGVG
ncbi:MAG: DUF397 domain-containing protein [Pseudonocardiaceae bacterium]